MGTEAATDGIANDQMRPPCSREAVVAPTWLSWHRLVAYLDRGDHRLPLALDRRAAGLQLDREAGSPDDIGLLRPCSAAVLAVVLLRPMQALAVRRAPQQYRGLDVEAALKFDAEQAHGAVAAGQGDPGHGVSGSSGLQQLPGQIEPLAANPLGSGATQAG